MNNTCCVLIADDETIVRQSISEVLRAEGYKTIEAKDGRECLDVLAREAVDILLLDIHMPNLNGMETLSAVSRGNFKVDTIMISGNGTVQNAVEAIKFGANDFIEKPFSFDHLINLVKSIADKRIRSQKLHDLKQHANTVGKYIIRKEISRGGSAIVYHGLQPDLNRPVAIKILHPHLMDVGTFSKRFYREAQITASLSHPNIVQIFDYGEHENNFYLAMEFIEGCSLEHYLSEERRLPLNLCVLIGITICRALEYAHKNGVLHRDIKPQNVMISSVGVVKLADFGLARCLDADDEALTRSDLLAGTPQFMSPEQVEGQELSFASDIFSLGTLLYALTTLRVPFPGTTLASIANNILNFKAVDPRKFNPRISREQSHIITKCLNKKVSGRYQTVHNVRLALESSIQPRDILNADQLLEHYFVHQSMAKADQAGEG
jgi:serine/threonine protein kinase